LSCRGARSRQRACFSVRPLSPLLERPSQTRASLTLASATAAIRDPNPVLFLEPKILYRSAVEQVPTGDFELPLSSAEVLREGADLTIVSYGPPLYTIETALHHLKHPSEELAALIPESLRNLSIELIDLRTIVPYDVRPPLSFSVSPPPISRLTTFSHRSRRSSRASTRRAGVSSSTRRRSRAASRASSPQRSSSGASCASRRRSSVSPGGTRRLEYVFVLSVGRARATRG